MFVFDINYIRRMSFQSIDEQLKTKQHLLDEIAEMGHTLAEDAQTEEDKFLIDGKVGLDVAHTNRESRLIASIKTPSFSNDDGDGNEKVKKAKGLLRNTSSFHVQHAFLYIFLPLLHDYDVKMPSFTFYGGRKQATTNFSSSF